MKTTLYFLAFLLLAVGVLLAFGSLAGQIPSLIPISLLMGALVSGTMAAVLDRLDKLIAKP